MAKLNEVLLELSEFETLRRHGFDCCFGSGFFIFRELWKRGDKRVEAISQRAVELCGVRAGDTILKVCKLQDRTFAELIAIQGARLNEVRGIGAIIFSRMRRSLLTALEENAGFKFHTSKVKCKSCDLVAQYNQEWKLWDGEKVRIAKLPKTGDEIRREKQAKQREHEKNQTYFNFGKD
jgi:hypothetical protein